MARRLPPGPGRVVDPVPRPTAARRPGPPPGNQPPYVRNGRKIGRNEPCPLRVGEEVQAVPRPAEVRPLEARWTPRMPVGLTAPNRSPRCRACGSAPPRSAAGAPRATTDPVRDRSGASCAATFTRNAFCAAPVTVAREHLARATPRYLLVNAGNANAGTGARGGRGREAVLRDRRRRHDGRTGRGAWLPFSTGVIGEPLAIERFERAVPAAAGRLGDAGWLDAAAAIVTTDIVPKGASRTLELGGRPGDDHRESPRARCMIRRTWPRCWRSSPPGRRRRAGGVAGDGEGGGGGELQPASPSTATPSTNDACVLVATAGAGNPPVEAGTPECGRAGRGDRRGRAPARPMRSCATGRGRRSSSPWRSPRVRTGPNASPSPMPSHTPRW